MLRAGRPSECVLVRSHVIDHVCGPAHGPNCREQQKKEKSVTLLPSLSSFFCQLERRTTRRGRPRVVGATTSVAPRVLAISLVSVGTVECPDL